ncbi:helix-turn-helix transcriptional regulator [Chitinophaga sp. Mgbs1]|uniref:Helix-turn-helix transcriptional regulator n=1 Tax=Chitinophaga solisilvae TaxID=1233460 RepID=A0A433WPR6_9BACT|nr:helix-turn-helix transcriptional regulator [Chitinophaga solisilvae]
MSLELFNIGQGYAVFTESDYETRRHAHYAIEIVYAATGVFSISTRHGEYHQLENVIIPSNLPHRFSCLNATCQLVFLDPLSAAGRYFVRLYQLDTLRDVLVNVPGLIPLYREEKQVLPDMNNTPGMDSRILHCMEMIDARLTGDNIPLAELSAAVCLSEGRLSHLFKGETGISVHQYMLWKKMLLAVRLSREGHSLTACAHYVGFTDSSHFNRVFYRMFGIKPFFALKS